MGCIHDYIERNFSEKRKIHTYAVCDTAKALAEYYGEDIAKAETAALFHDMFRSVSEASLNTYVRQLGLPSKYLNNSNLAHGKIAAIIMERDFGIVDSDIIHAVAFHTTGRANMSRLEKILYLADAIEPGRVYPGVENLRNMAYQGLDQACLACVSQSIEFIKSRGIFLDEDTLLAKAYLEEIITK